MGARQILAEAFRSNPDNEDIYLAACKLENDNKETQVCADVCSRMLTCADVC